MQSSQLSPHARAMMARDMNIIRKICLEIQSRTDTKPQAVRVDGVDEETLLRHLEMMYKAGLLEATEVHYCTSNASGLPRKLDVRDLSWDGHDFAAAIKNDSVWSRMTTALSPSDLAGLPLSVVKDIAVALLRGWARQKLGLGPG